MESTKTKPIANEEFELNYERHPAEIIEPEKEKQDGGEKPSPNGKTDWKMVAVAAILYFLTGLEATFTGLSDWPYMQQIDKNATYDFFGDCNAISNSFLCVFVVVFSVWTLLTNSARWPLVAGRLLAFLGSALYVCVELFHENRRYVMLACYVLFGIAAASSVVLRVYLVRITLEHDRPRAFGAITLGKMASTILGPLVQLAFSPLNYPGLKIVKGIHFNMYSAPIWIATLLNFLTVFFIFFVLRDLPPKLSKEEVEGKEKKEPFKLTKENLKDLWRKFVDLKVNWPVIILSLFEVCVLSIALASVASLITVIFLETFGFGKQQTTIWISVIMGSIGVLSLIITVFYMATPLLRVSPRNSFLVALFVGTIIYVLTYPYPGMSNPIPQFNMTTMTGCNPLEYHWCHKNRATYEGLFIPLVIIVIGVALPTATISLDIIYTQKCGKANQTVMQGLIVLVYNIINVLAPLWSTMMFTHTGQHVLWICNGAFTLAGTLLWLVFFPWLKVKTD